MDARIASVRDFIHYIKPRILQSDSIVPITDPYGPSVVDPDMRCIVVSEETKKGGDAVNRVRQEKHMAVDVVNVYARWTSICGWVVQSTMGRAQSKAACQTAVPTMMQQEAQVPTPSAATDSPQRTGAIVNIHVGTVSGSHCPIIAGSSGVSFTHSLPSDAAGVPPQSLRPDQDPTVGDLNQEVGNKTRDILRTCYKTTGSYVQLNPGVPDDQRPIVGIYTKLRVRTKKGTLEEEYSEETVYSTEYEKILKDWPETEFNRAILFGIGGVGKSTIFDKIAYDWADEVCEILKRFKLVFLLKMCALFQESDLVDSIFDQLLGVKSGVAKDELDQYIQDNSNKVLILLDGFDEMRTKTLDAASFGFILKALNRTEYRKCYMFVSTRPSHLETLMSKSLVQNPCTHVEVLGFTKEDVNEYILKFCYKDPDSGNALIQKIAKSNTLSDFATNPMLLLLMCQKSRCHNWHALKP
ncbi:uncharacterized protein LOC119719760 [Patiria miniata]|uniref:NACHT domain-containing protein n=1 Tax=Patiria miniata TaxID=46514 RepID=A0A913Z026_PATMI|nr:uncharacterized protein LOC119719760 [Patiria miniata]